MKEKQEIRTHDTITRQHEVKIGSDKSFGLVFGCVFAALTFLPLLHGKPPLWWLLAPAAAFGAAAFIMPGLLHPLNRLWFKFGLLLHKIVSPAILGLLFALTIMPAGLIARALGKDMLRLKKDPAAESYWIKRDPAGPSPESFERQF